MTKGSGFKTYDNAVHLTVRTKLWKLQINFGENITSTYPARTNPSGANLNFEHKITSVTA